ncbi:MAG: MGH1-like glycoside hydrolase domain-containing protein [Mycobacterium leprae]
MDKERTRLRKADLALEPWRQWGPYLSERAWGTVREDYSPKGDAWDYLTYDHARSRAFRWSEDGLAGICDDRQLLCLAMAFWNGSDRYGDRYLLKERLFGLTNGQGNHGEDVKECWWYLDATPTHSWMRWRYHYPQRPFPYNRLRKENGENAHHDPSLPEFELFDTGVFEGDRYWQITVDYAKALPQDICARIRVRNAGPEEATIDVLPTLWCRNIWSWDDPGPRRPRLYAEAGDARTIVAKHDELGEPFRLIASDDPDLLFCENDSNRTRLGWGDASPPYPKDGINDFVVDEADTVNPDLTGTKAALRYRLTVPAGEQREIRLRLAPETDDAARDLGAGFDKVLADREQEADAFYATLTPNAEELRPGEATVLRQAFAGALWSKQFYHYDVDRWLTGDHPKSSPPPKERQHPEARNVRWRHLRNAEIISMPDKWEYPWYASWDLAFHSVVLAHVDPEFAKRQLVLLTGEGYANAEGQVPAFEWDFGAVNPPVHGWATNRVFEIDGSRDFLFLELMMDRLRRNFGWWQAQHDKDGNNVFGGGFLGLDNIGPLDRSKLPAGVTLEQSDGTAWMAMYSLNLLEIAFRLSRHNRAYEDVAIEFFDHFLRIANAMDDTLWCDADGFYYDRMRIARRRRLRGGRRTELLRVRSISGLIALCAVTYLNSATLAGMPRFEEKFRDYLDNRPDLVDVVSYIGQPGNEDRYLLSVVTPERLRRILDRVLSEAEFLSPYGLRSLSRMHRGSGAYQLKLPGLKSTVSYDPGESTDKMFGGNSNWRGPVWFPLNYLLTEALRRFDAYFGNTFKVAFPSGSPTQLSLQQVATALAERLTSLFLTTADGQPAPAFGRAPLFRTDDEGNPQHLFFEYFHGDDGAGLGASHQTGWTALVADLINSRGRGERTRLRGP